MLNKYHPKAQETNRTVVGGGKMNNDLTKLIEWRRNLLKLSVIQIPNTEWLYMLTEETRNSLMIEGIFATDEELEGVLNGRYKSSREVVNYFRTASFFYDLAFEYYKTGENPYSLAIVRMCHKKLFEGIISNSERLGNFRNGPIKITGAKIKPPEYDISDWVSFWLKYIQFVYDNHPVHEATARAHVLFESIHPFEDGNGRIGRILMNFYLIYHGYINITIKGMEQKERNEYIKALENAEKGIRRLFKYSPKDLSAEQVDKMFSSDDTKKLSALLGLALIDALDRQICSANKDKLISADEFAKRIGKTTDAVRKMIERKKLIATKPAGRWFVYPEMMER